MSWVEDKRKKCDLGLRNVFWNEDWTGCAWTGKRWVEAEKNGTLVELKEKIMESMIEDFYKKEVETVQWRQSGSRSQFRGHFTFIFFYLQKLNLYHKFCIFERIIF